MPDLIHKFRDPRALGQWDAGPEVCQSLGSQELSLSFEGLGGTQDQPSLLLEAKIESTANSIHWRLEDSKLTHQPIVGTWKVYIKARQQEGGEDAQITPIMVFEMVILPDCP